MGRFDKWRRFYGVKSTPGRRHKYKAQPKIIDGIRFASTLEATHYGRLKLLKRSGEIRGFEMQVRFVIAADPIELSITYVADFVVTYPDGRWVVQDCKGYRTKEYLRKKRLLKNILGIEIVEIIK